MTSAPHPLEMASALTFKVDQVYERNDSLEAENDSLRTAFDAVSAENEHLRKYAEEGCAPARRGHAQG